MRPSIIGSYAGQHSGTRPGKAAEAAAGIRRQVASSRRSSWKPVTAPSKPPGCGQLRSATRALKTLVAIGRRTGNRDDVYQLPRDRIDAVRPWFTPELPGPVIFAHIRHSGVGRCLVDRWPDPRVVLAQTSSNYAIRGNPDALDNSALDDLAGFVEAPSVWEPMLRRIDPGLAMWNRVVAVLPAADSAPPPDPRIRRLTASDTQAVGQLHPKISWISDTWGGPAGLAASGMAWAAFDAGTPVAVAVPFFVGDRFEDIGVVTDIRRRRHTPTWTTSPDNIGSLAVAEWLGFMPERHDVLWAVRTPIPTD